MITFGEMREMGIRGVLVYCSDYRCSHSIALSADRWSGVRLSDIEPRFVCKACGQRGADVRPDFDGGQAPFDPIQVDGRKLVTLRDTGEYIAGLPKKEHAAPEWQAAMETLILVAEGGGQRCSPVSALCEH